MMLRIFALGIPAQQGLDGKAMSEIMKARSTAGRRAAESNLPGQRIEDAVNIALVQVILVLVYEKVCLCPQSKEAVSVLRVGSQNFARRGV